MDKVAEGLPLMTEQELEQLDLNCDRLAASNDGHEKSQALLMSEAVNVERQRRKESQDEALRMKIDEIEKANADLPLNLRVENAFRADPPLDHERAALQTIADHPGLDHNEIAEKLGYKDGGAVNMIVGTMCRKREPYLGVAPLSTARPDEKFYSGLLIDMERVAASPDGRGARHLWSLKKGVEAGLRDIGVIA